MLLNVPLFKYTAIYLFIQPVVDIWFQFGAIVNSAAMCIMYMFQEHIHASLLVECLGTMRPGYS